MAGDAGGGEQRPQKHKSKHRPKRRMGIRMDMTPMVDVAFLLLTFFMLTTVFRRPQTLEIKLPPSSNKSEISEAGLLIFRVDEEGSLYFSKGLSAPEKMEFKSLPGFLKDKYREDPNAIILVKIDRKAKYQIMVDIIDEMNLAKLSRYSVASLAEEEKEEIKKVNEKK